MILLIGLLNLFALALCSKPQLIVHIGPSKTGNYMFDIL